jgi:hypothetical protein
MILIVILSIPAVLLILVFYFISGKYSFTFKVTGYLSFRDLRFILDTDQFHMELHIDAFKIYLIWLRVRVYLQGVKCTFKYKNKDVNFLKKEMSKSDFIDMFGKLI